MPLSIQPRGRRPSFELKNFTDREPQREILARLLSLKPGQPLPVLHFYGVGGIGKSWLLTLWRQSINDHKWLKLALYPYIPVGFINLEKAGLDEAANLHRVRTEFAAVPCPRFDTAYAWLRFKQQVKDKPGVKGSGLARNFVEALGEFASGAGALFGMPLIGKLVKWGAKQGKNVADYFGLEKWLLSKTGQDDFLRLQSMTIDQLFGDHGNGPRQTLATRLRDDLHENLPDHKSDYACRGVLFLDTFEVLRRGSSSSIHADMREEWVRDLHSTDGRLLIVSAGQNRLRWDECDVEYRDERYMEQHLLGGLSADDATLFLGKCGVNDALLRNAVLKASVDVEDETTETSYHPASLGICADAIQIETKRGIAVDPATFDFPAGDWLQLSTRFLKSLPDDEERAWVQKLALPPRFDKTAARAMSSRPDTAGKILISVRYSFIRDDDEAGWYLLYGRMREALNRVANEPELISEQHTEWRSHWQSRSQKDTDEFAALAWFHRYQLEPTEAFDEWNQLCEAKKKALDMVAHFELLSWWEPTGVLTAKKWTESEAEFLTAIGIEYINTTLGNRGDSIRNAIDCFKAVLTVYTKESFPEQWASNQNSLGIAHAELPDNNGINLRIAIEFYLASLTVFTKEAFPQKWASTQNNIGNSYSQFHLNTNWLERLEILQLAIDYFKAALSVYTKETFAQSWAMTQNNLGCAYAKLSDKDRHANMRAAIICFEASLTVYTKESFPLRWAGVQMNLGAAYSGITDNDVEVNLSSAIECFKSALLVYKQSTYPESWAATQNNLGNIYARILDTGDTNLNRAIDCYKAALTIRTKETFPQDWASTQKNLGNIYAKLLDGDRAANLRAAFDSYNAVLTVHTKESLLLGWSMIQFDLGMLQIEFANIDDQEKHLQQAETYFINSELGIKTSGITLGSPTVRDALARVRAKLAQLETEGSLES